MVSEFYGFLRASLFREVWTGNMLYQILTQIPLFNQSIQRPPICCPKRQRSLYCLDQLNINTAFSRSRVLPDNLNFTIATSHLWLITSLNEFWFGHVTQIGHITALTNRHRYYFNTRRSDYRVNMSWLFSRVNKLLFNVILIIRWKVILNKYISPSE